MNQKDLIKYALIALGAYLVYKYIEDNGGFSAVLGQMTGTGSPAGTTTDCASLLKGQATVNNSNAAQLAAAGIVLSATQLSQITTCGATPLTDAQLKVLQGAAAVAFTQPVPTSGAPILDTSGLTVVKDINNSLKGTVKINGVPTDLAIIQPNGGVYDNSGQEISAQLTAEGVDLNMLKSAFTQAGQGLGMFADAWQQSSAWMN